MKPIIPKAGPYLQRHRDKNKNAIRFVVVLDDGRMITYARLVMANFLHAVNFPKCFHVHHINGITDDDKLENLQLLCISDHIKLHQPRGSVKYGFSHTENPREYDKACRNNPENKIKSKQKRKEIYSILKDDPLFKNKRNEKDRALYHKRKENQDFINKRKISNHKYYNSHKELESIRKKKSYLRKKLKENRNATTT